jgi:hypothetical protein
MQVRIVRLLTICVVGARDATGAWLLGYEDFTLYDKLPLVEQLVQQIVWCSTSKVRFLGGTLHWDCMHDEREAVLWCRLDHLWPSRNVLCCCCCC